MEIQHFKFICPKKGSKSSECEDALSVSQQKHRFCVTDGASDAFDSRSWARLLAASWKVNTKGFPFQKEQFEQEVQALAEKWKRRWAGRELPWYKEAKSKKRSVRFIFRFRN